jgi:amino acid adenylation domain-containing protein
VTEPLLDLDESLVAAFQRVAASVPSRIALCSDVWEPTYRELNERANRLAHRLIACGVAPGDRVAILMSHDTPAIGAVLGALKAGAIVMACDPGDPPSRLEMLVEDAEPGVIVTDVHNLHLAVARARANLGVLNFESETATGPGHNAPIEIPSRQTAFLTYTSGTTGRPKGVMQAHRQLRRSAAAFNDAIQYTANDRIPLFSLLSTGFGVGSGLWSALLHGATLCTFPVKTRSIAELANWIVDRQLTVYVSAPSLFRTLTRIIDDRLVFAGVRAVVLHGEAVTAVDFQAFRRHFPRTSILVHTLACAEANNIAWSHWTQHDEIPAGTLPVGHFSRDTDISLIGEDGEPVKRGEVGEIAVTSRYLANGYWRDPELTAQRFSADLDDNGTRRLRTGDQGRINVDGLLEYCGRKDDRIKIRGHRIEPLDVERVIETLPGIDGVAVVAVARDNFEPLLVAFVVKPANSSWTAQRLEHVLRANLPLRMRPSRIEFVDRLPYNSNNKIDRAALRHYSLPARKEKKADAPRTEREMVLAEIWAKVFGLPGVGRDTDFFHLGGDSLIGAIIAAEVYAALGVTLSLAAIADHPTVSALAAFIDANRNTTTAAIAPAMVRVPRAATMPMSLQQEAIWNYRESLEDRAILTHVRNYRVRGPLDIDVLKECLNYLTNRHEILRTTFGLVGGCPVQIIHESGRSGLAFVDLIDASDAEAEADQIFRRESAKEIDLETLPIRRNVLIRVGRDNFRLLRISHRLIIDGLASQILDAELAILYDALLHGKEPPLPEETPLRYADYAVWQRQVMRPDGTYFDELMNWWRNLLATAPPATPSSPKQRLRHASRDPSEGVIRWKVEEEAARSLEAIARRVGATYFTVRLAAFAALLADRSARSTVVIAVGFANRNRVETQNMVGPFLNPIHLVISYDENKIFFDWLAFVRDRVFEATTRGELPFSSIYEQLRASGAALPAVQFYFTISRDHSDQHFGNLVISDEFWRIGTMPSGRTIYIDERKPENCRINFDANIYDRDEMKDLVDEYLRLLEAVAQEPGLPIGKLLITMRWDDAIAEIIAGGEWEARDGPVRDS